MNKDIDNIDSTDKSVEKALDIMESYNKKVEWNYPI